MRWWSCAPALISAFFFATDPGEKCQKPQVYSRTQNSFQNWDSMLFPCRNKIVPLRNAQKVSQNTKRTRSEAWTLDSALPNSQYWHLDHPWARTLHLVQWEWLDQKLIFHSRCYCHLVVIPVVGLKRAPNIVWAWFFWHPSLPTQFWTRTWGCSGDMSTFEHSFYRSCFKKYV